MKGLGGLHLQLEDAEHCPEFLALRVIDRRIRAGSWSLWVDRSCCCWFFLCCWLDCSRLLHWRLSCCVSRTRSLRRGWLGSWDCRRLSIGHLFLNSRLITRVQTATNNYEYACVL